MNAQELIERGAMFYVSHSGGKDSQAMYARLSAAIPAEQITVVHAHLGKIEWEGVEDHIRENIRHPLNVVRAGKTFFEMVRHRAQTRPDVPSFPSSATRQCTSDLKRGPIYKFIRRDMNSRGLTLGVNCMGLRAEESPRRSRLETWAVNGTLTTTKRTVWNWLPIQRLKTPEVFEAIRKAEQKPFWAYAAGNKRLSCVFCILGCPSDLANGRKHRPELYNEYVRLQKETGWTMFSDQSLEQRIAEANDTNAAAGQERLPFGGPPCWD